MLFRRYTCSPHLIAHCDFHSAFLKFQRLSSSPPLYREATESWKDDGHLEVNSNTHHVEGTFWVTEQSSENVNTRSLALFPPSPSNTAPSTGRRGAFDKVWVHFLKLGMSKWDRSSRQAYCFPKPQGRQLDQPFPEAPGENLGVCVTQPVIRAA